MASGCWSDNDDRKWARIPEIVSAMLAPGPRPSVRYSLLRSNFRKESFNCRKGKGVVCCPGNGQRSVILAARNANKEKSYRVLEADDQPAILEALKMLLRSEGFEVETVSSPRIVLESLALREYDVLLSDLNCARDPTSGKEGISLLQSIRELGSQVQSL